MLKEHINDIMTRWSPKQRPGSSYDPTVFLESPEQARRLIRHLQEERNRAANEKNRELVEEIEGVLERVEKLAKQFFRWEQALERTLEAQERKEIEKLPLGF
ncbi:MAG: hypothetical protein ACP5M0_00950 [Desulfomonilaceae bacterium]